MKKVIKGTLQEADHSPVRVGDKIVFVKEAKGSGPGGGGRGGNGGDKLTPPRKSLEERIVNVLKATVPSMITEAISPVVTRLDNIDTRLGRLETDVNDLKTRMTKVEQRLGKQDEFNQYIKNVFEKNKLS